MLLFAPSLAIVDLETTGTHAGRDRITEIGIVRVDADAAGGPPRVSEWSSLIDPEVPIPPVIQALTGITDAMVAGAPTFAALASDVRERLGDSIFVAHNARFDHGFLKHAFARAGLPFAARPLCTVRLSRRLFPDVEGGHGLDAVVARHDIAVAGRHRALGDARAVWHFIEAAYRALPPEAIESAARRLLRMPSLPPQLPPDALDGIPEAPGVYRFFGDNPLPIYIGKSINLRERVAAHFSADWQSEKDARLSQEIRRIEVEETAGELGALLREAMLVKTELPAHNRALRRKEDAGVLTLDDDGTPRFHPASRLPASALGHAYGPFGSRRSAMEMLRELAASHGLCWRRLQLEKRAVGPCFQRQLHRCRGACTGEETAESHDLRLRTALMPLRIPAWPLPGPGLAQETTADGSRTDVHVLLHWCWLGTARDEQELADLLADPPAPSFDLDVARLLLKRWARGQLPLVPVVATPRHGATSPDGVASASYDDFTTS